MESFVEINEEEFLKRMKTEKIHWNIDKLKTVKAKKIKANRLCEKQMLEIVIKAMKAALITKEDMKDLLDYIYNLFHPESEYSRWPMIDQFIPMTLNFLGNILEHLNTKLDSKDLNSIAFCLGDIAEGVRFCPDRQMAELKRAYSLISGNTETELDSFIYQIIETVKERIFDLAVTPTLSGQNVHVLTYWKYEMRETLGFDFEFKSRIGTMDQDPFDGCRGNALQAFFCKFTPKYVISVLTKYINEKKDVMFELMNLIHRDESLSDEEKVEMGLDVEYGESEQITEKATEYILVKKRLLIKKLIIQIIS